MRNFWFKKNVGDWLKDPNLSLCSPAARGIWEDAICRMFELKSGELTGTYEQLSRSLRASAKEVELAFDELANTGTADLQRGSNAVVTLICRRLQREFKKKQQTKLRVAKTRENPECNAHSNASVTVQSKKLELELELETTNSLTACGEAEKAPPSPPVQESPILLSFPIVGKGGPEWHLRESLRVELAGLFPGVDVVGESRKAEAWVRAKPTNRKTASGMRSFLTGWITRGINRGDIKASGTKPSESQTVTTAQDAQVARDRYRKKFKDTGHERLSGLLDVPQPAREWPSEVPT